MKKKNKNQSKILLWDLETTDLKASHGFIICVAAKWLDEPKFALSMRIDDVPGYGTTPRSYMNDKPLVKAIVDLLDQADASVAHYGDRFDRRFLITRALVHGINPPAPTKLLDTWRYARNNLALQSNRLAMLCDTFKVAHPKYHLPTDTILLARYGDRKSLREMQKYNENDVLGLEEVYKEIRALINDHPNCSGVSGQCFACGSERLESRGYRLTKAYRIQRFQCKDCGTWNTGKQERIK